MAARRPSSIAFISSGLCSGPRSKDPSTFSKSRDRSYISGARKNPSSSSPSMGVDGDDDGDADANGVVVASVTASLFGAGVAGCFESGLLRLSAAASTKDSSAHSSSLSRLLLERSEKGVDVSAKADGVL